MSIQEEVLDEKIHDLLQEYLEMLEGHLKELITDSSKWLRTSEASEYLSISQSQLHKLKAEGIISCTKLGGTNYYDREEIDDLLEANKSL